MENLEHVEFKNYIDGQWVSTSHGTFKNINPANITDIVGLFQDSREEDAREAVRAAQAAFHEWRATPVTKRANILLKAADLLEERADQIGEELTREEGKLYGQARGEVLRSAQTLRFYAIEGQTYTGETYPQDDAGMLVYSHPEPLGVVSVIAPWNFPISIPSRKIAPALITGNTVVFKPSTDAPLSGYRLVEALVEAGLPAGVLNFLTGRASNIGEILVSSPEIRAVTFTGSTQAGEAIHRAADMTTRLQMELGGKNPLIIMPDADIAQAVKLVVQGGLALTGQACTGTSRILVHKDIRSKFTNALLEAVSKLKVGNGFNTDVDLGPMATKQQLETVLSYVEIGKTEATHLVGGERLSGLEYDNGFFVSPAVFTDVTNDMRIAQEEIFGPVLAIIEIDNYEHAVELANDTPYGLSAGIVTNDPVLMHRFVTDIESGTVKINRTTTGNLINAPFGGVKRSSTATFRESGRAGLDFFVQVKTVYVGH